MKLVIKLYSVQSFLEEGVVGGGLFVACNLLLDNGRLEERLVL